MTLDADRSIRPEKSSQGIYIVGVDHHHCLTAEFMIDGGNTV
jgi:hypothetical protein